MKDIIRVCWDASCDNNSKFKYMGLGVAVFVNDEYKPDLSLDLMYGTNGTNNIGEWAGLELALKHCSKLIELYPDGIISLYGDSQLVVRQFNGEYRVKADILKQYFKDCKLLYLALPSENMRRVEWIPRTQNKEADKLSKKATIDFINSLSK